MNLLAWLTFLCPIAHVVTLRNGVPALARDVALVTPADLASRNETSTSLDSGALKAPGVHSQPIQSVVPIVPESQYQCYGCDTREKAREYRHPVFPAGGVWPVLKLGTHRIDGLVNPRAFVVSLVGALPRRKIFAHEWAKLDLDVNATWVEAVDGVHNRTRTKFMSEFNAAQPNDRTEAVSLAQAACWESHAGILNAAHEHGDLMVFEDDVGFADDFPSRLADLVSNLPNDWDVLHLGGDDFWDPPMFELPGKWIRVRAASRTWGYIVRWKAVKRLQTALALTLDLRAFDTFLGGLAFSCKKSFQMKTYAPEEPMVYPKIGSESMTGQADPNFNYSTEENTQQGPIFWEPMTFCEDAKSSLKVWCCSRDPPGPWKRPAICDTLGHGRKISLLQVEGLQKLTPSSVCAGVSTCELPRD